MWRLRRLAPVLCLAAAGCGFGHKPYANDPLLRGGRPVWLARDPAAPTPPTGPLAQQPVEPPPPPATSRLE